MSEKMRAGESPVETPGLVEGLWLLIERQVNRFTSPEYNPFYCLGAMGILFLWVILVSGLYLFLFYNISAKGAYASVEYLSVRQWYLGGVMRSLHRYASDGLVIVAILHAARSFFFGKYRHWRWLPWVSGVLLAWIIVIGGIFGYWMVWDEKARIVATLSADMIEALPIFGLPLNLNFARAENLTDQLFYIVLFIHFFSIVVIFLLLLIHLTRMTKAVITPPRPLIYGAVLTLFIISFVKPALSAPAADLKALPSSIPFDWFFMFIFPGLKYASAEALWAFIAACTVIIAIIPWLTRVRRNPAVEVVVPNCTGCELCMEDCPYVAITMRPRTDGMSYPVEAVVNNARCASCGICVGACDYGALSLPHYTEEDTKRLITGYSRELVGSASASNKGELPPSVLAFVCAKGAGASMRLDGGRMHGVDGVRVVIVPCIGMVQPSMMEIAFSEGVDGVFAAGCRPGDCHFRSGNAWFEGRLAGFRPPVVKRSLPRARIKYAGLSAVESAAFLSELEAFKNSLESDAKGGNSPAAADKYTELV